MDEVVQTVGVPAAGNTSLRSNYSHIITPGVVREVRSIVVSKVWGRWCR